MGYVHLWLKSRVCIQGNLSHECQIKCWLYHGPDLKLSFWAIFLFDKFNWKHGLCGLCLDLWLVSEQVSQACQILSMSYNMAKPFYRWLVPCTIMPQNYSKKTKKMKPKPWWVREAHPEQGWNVLLTSGPKPNEWRAGWWEDPNWC
jgi:hypothetical protein